MANVDLSKPHPIFGDVRQKIFTGSPQNPYGAVDTALGNVGRSLQRFGQRMMDDAGAERIRLDTLKGENAAQDYQSKVDALLVDIQQDVNRGEVAFYDIGKTFNDRLSGIFEPDTSSLSRPAADAVALGIQKIKDRASLDATRMTANARQASFGAAMMDFENVAKKEAANVNANMGALRQRIQAAEPMAREWKGEGAEKFVRGLLDDVSEINAAALIEQGKDSDKALKDLRYQIGNEKGALFGEISGSSKVTLVSRINRYLESNAAKARAEQNAILGSIEKNLETFDRQRLAGQTVRDSDWEETQRLARGTPMEKAVLAARKNYDATQKFLSMPDKVAETKIVSETQRLFAEGGSPYEYQEQAKLAEALKARQALRADSPLDYDLQFGTKENLKFDPGEILKKLSTDPAGVKEDLTRYFKARQAKIYGLQKDDQRVSMNLLYAQEREDFRKLFQSANAQTKGQLFDLLSKTIPDKAAYIGTVNAICGQDFQSDALAGVLYANPKTNQTALNLMAGAEANRASNKNVAGRPVSGLSANSRQVVSILSNYLGNAFAMNEKQLLLASRYVQDYLVGAAVNQGAQYMLGEKLDETAVKNAADQVLGVPLKRGEMTALLPIGMSAAEGDLLVAQLARPALIAAGMPEAEAARKAWELGIVRDPNNPNRYVLMQDILTPLKSIPADGKGEGKDIFIDLSNPPPLPTFTEFKKAYQTEYENLPADEVTVFSRND